MRFESQTHPQDDHINRITDYSTQYGQAHAVSTRVRLAKGRCVCVAVVYKCYTNVLCLPGYLYTMFAGLWCTKVIQMFSVTGLSLHCLWGCGVQMLYKCSVFTGLSLHCVYGAVVYKCYKNVLCLLGYLYTVFVWLWCTHVIKMFCVYWVIFTPCLWGCGVQMLYKCFVFTGLSLHCVCGAVVYKCYKNVLCLLGYLYTVFVCLCRSRVRCLASSSSCRS